MRSTISNLFAMSILLPLSAGGAWAGDPAPSRTNPVVLICEYPAADGPGIHLDYDKVTYKICDGCTVKDESFYQEHPDWVRAYWKVSDTEYVSEADSHDSNSGAVTAHSSTTINRADGSLLYRYTLLPSGAQAVAHGQCKKFDKAIL